MFAYKRQFSGRQSLYSFYDKYLSFIVKSQLPCTLFADSGESLLTSAFTPRPLAINSIMCCKRRAAAPDLAAQLLSISGFTPRILLLI